MGNLVKSWDSYKKRLLPWILLKYRLNSDTLATEAVLSDDKTILEQICRTFESLHLLDTKKEELGNPGQVLYDVQGFNIERQESQIPKAGQGVFVTCGKICKGQVAALYPGTVYTPGNAIFFQSIRNSFLFKCKDQLYIDGKDCGLSKKIFKSCAGRDQVGPYKLCDETWLSEKLSSPLNVGQYVNNQTKEYPANVQYQEFDFPREFPIHLRRFIPNISINGLSCHTSLRTVVLIATKDIEESEELLSTYLTVIS